jgi:type I restriction enzyme R subunit
MLKHDNVPAIIEGNDDAIAFYGVIKPLFDNLHVEEIEQTSADAALAIYEIVSNHYKVHFWEDTDAQNQAINDIDDYLYDELKGKRGIELTVDEMDKIIKRCMDLAKHRSGR